ncbi:MAG: DUF4091 domain-containing protein [Erysipelotrichaceae bacterium]|nr:DUF4091 domain-containing protein [Erysipelotrichaceae bacterium]
MPGKTIRKLIAAAACAVLSSVHVLPLQAEDLPVSVAFTDPGKLDGEEDDTFRTLFMWRNDKACLRLKVRAEEDTDLRIRTEFDDGTLQGAVYVLEPVSASLGMGTPDAFPHVDVPDRMVETQELHLRAGEDTWVVVEVCTGEDTPAGSHEAAVHLESDSGSSSSSFQVSVCRMLMPEERMSLDLWQYPWSSYYYYAALQGKEPFGEEHLSVLRKEMELYSSLGGNTVTVSIIDEPWSHQTYYDTPSLITWNRDDSGYIWFDFTYFDRWVELCEACGVDGRIESFSILPFANVLYIHLPDGSTERLTPEPGSYQWNSVWTLFLQKYTEHLKEKGWLERTYMFIDERNEQDMRLAAELIRSCVDENGNGLKLACALNKLPSDTGLLEMMDYVSFSVAALPEAGDPFYDTVHRLQENGTEVTAYNCSTVYPNAFAVSEPEESLWTMAYIRSLGLDGYLRWALNAWTADPLHSFDFRNFEAGDTYLIYPDERDSTDPVPARSYRLCMIEEGMRRAAKYDWLLENAAHHSIRRFLEQESAVQRVSSGEWNAWGMVTGTDRDRQLITAEVHRMDGVLNKASYLQDLVSAFRTLIGK